MLHRCPPIPARRTFQIAVAMVWPPARLSSEVKHDNFCGIRNSVQRVIQPGIIEVIRVRPAALCFAKGDPQECELRDALARTSDQRRAKRRPSYLVRLVGAVVNLWVLGRQVAREEKLQIFNVQCRALVTGSGELYVDTDQRANRLSRTELAGDESAVISCRSFVERHFAVIAVAIAQDGDRVFHPGQ